jgi:hypothetical protein
MAPPITKAGETRDSRPKVFCFFSSEKKTFLRLIVLDQLALAA